MARTSSSLTPFLAYALASKPVLAGGGGALVLAAGLAWALLMKIYQSRAIK